MIFSFNIAICICICICITLLCKCSFFTISKSNHKNHKNHKKEDHVLTIYLNDFDVERKVKNLIESSESELESESQLESELESESESESEQVNSLVSDRFYKQEQEQEQQFQLIEKELQEFCQDDSRFEFHFVLYYTSYWSQSFVDRIQNKINELIQKYPFIQETDSSKRYTAYEIDNEPSGYRVKKTFTKNILDMIFPFSVKHKNTKFHLTNLLCYSDEKWQQLLEESYHKLQQLKLHMTIEQITPLEAQDISNRPEDLFPCYVYEPHIILQVWHDVENHYSLDIREIDQFKQDLLDHDCTIEEIDQMMWNNLKNY